MLLETLLLSPCFLTGKTSHTDSKTTLTVNKGHIENDETVLFFHIDDQSNKCCKFRKSFLPKHDGCSLCDLLVFYAKGDKRVFCFVELKDNKKDLVKAKDQLISTYDAFKAHIAPQFKFDTKAFICSSGGSLPHENKSCQNELNKKFSGWFEVDGESDEFLEFLRGKLKKTLNKGRKR
ncbi:MAG: hypothetical protein QX199_10830 [Methylococcaceae bacterium]